MAVGGRSAGTPLDLDAVKVGVLDETCLEARRTARARRQAQVDPVAEDVVDERRAEVRQPSPVGEFRHWSVAGFFSAGHSAVPVGSDEPDRSGSHEPKFSVDVKRVQLHGRIVPREADNPTTTEPRRPPAWRCRAPPESAPRSDFLWTSVRPVTWPAHVVIARPDRRTGDNNGGAVMSYAASRRHGMAFERVAGQYTRDCLGLLDPAQVESSAADALLAVLSRHPTLSVGRNSAVEGVRLTPTGGVVVVECTGSTQPSRSPGCVRPCTCRKLLGASAAVALACRLEGITPPGYLLVTTAMPEPGTSAAGWLAAMVWQNALGDTGGLEVHVLEPVRGTAEVWDAARLAERFTTAVAV